MKTFMVKSNFLKERRWYVVDAKDKVLGRLSSLIIKYLIGKYKVEYAPHIDIGDYVIVLNAKKVYISGKKQNYKIYYHHTGYIGGIKQLNFKQMMNKRSERVIEIAVKGMLPKGPLGRVMYSRLRVYAGSTHLHCAQTPKVINF
ncbi:50S ribosomal protein L13 [Candidatus Blochmannia ocreatus (nom. nud.)]|uniref:Large ribosomal subunit protein uL13 n=1 Tax=Candidatus Blochmannia ocreatus (nom. nud.) TaxID=251538 RepID=A0ABY4SVW2_9ENTR|nr:50S ribosomal protein L13 [Candidatus Blochmannia ocreatus]URJ25140.1 50S ribosomal protein L13 [Candidatus Blochmannia ocreatus]